MKTFSDLCKGLYQPMLDKASKDLGRDIGEIEAKYSARRFRFPPGAMYSEIWERYIADISVRVEIIFEACCQAYKSSSPRPQAEEFFNEFVSAETLERGCIAATAEHRFSDFNRRFKIRSFEMSLERYTSKLALEGSRVATYYSSKATAFISKSLLEEPCSQEPNSLPNTWYQRPIGQIGIGVLIVVFGVLTVFLIKKHTGLAL